MKKLIKASLALIASTPAIALAAPLSQCPTNAVGACTSTLPEMITVVSNTMLLLIGIIAILFLIIGGFQYITSAGNPETIGKAKTTIFYAIIGIIVALIAYVAVSFVIGRIIAPVA